MAKPNLTQISSLAGLLVAATLPTGCRHKPPEQLISDTLLQETATVEAVYVPSRMVELRTEDGDRETVMVSPAVRNLDQVEVGDRVVVSYYAGIAAEVKPPGSGVNEPTGDVSTVVARPGERPAGAVGSTVQTKVRIESVDKSENTVTFRRHDGMVRTLGIESPEGRRFIKRLEPGDEVEVTYTEALAVEVRPAG